MSDCTQTTAAKSQFIADLVRVCDIYCEAKGGSRSTVSRAIFGRSGHVDDMASGLRDISTATFERSLQWFSDNWPDGAGWPDGVDRPRPLEVNTGTPQVGSFQ